MVMRPLAVSYTHLDGVFNDGLEHELRHQHIQRQVLHVLYERKFPRETDALYLDVAVERSQLLAERHKFAAGDAAAQDVREVGGDGRDLGDLVYLAHPFDGVERVVEEVRIQLGLHHAYLCVAQFLAAAEDVYKRQA